MFQVDPKFLRNQKFAKKHNVKHPKAKEAVEKWSVCYANEQLSIV